MAKLKHRNFTFLNRYSYYVPTVADLFILLAWFIAGVILGNAASLLLGITGTTAIDITAMISYPLMFIPAMIYAGFKSQSYSMSRNGVRVDSNSWGGNSPAIIALIAMVGTFSLSFCSDALTSLLPPMPEWIANLLQSVTQGSLWANFICVSIFAPIFEEWLCRGMVMRGLLHNGCKPVWAIIISAVIFAVIHANPWQAIPALLLGMFFGLVYYKTGSLKLTMLMHFTNNTVALVISNCVDSIDEMDNWKNVIGTPMYWIYLTTAIIVTALAVKYFLGIKNNGDKGGMEPVACLFEQ